MNDSETRETRDRDIFTPPSLHSTPSSRWNRWPELEENQPSQINEHAHLTTHALYSQKQSGSFVDRCEKI
uniref:Uncharacterized protein n=1 Tax=Timema poppense TaxID=170557 RepID=A0A7R9H3I8_TIMPO|nr:unnamed protein product [Timema poppensis]